MSGGKIEVLSFSMPSMKWVASIAKYLIWDPHSVQTNALCKRRTTAFLRKSDSADNAEEKNFSEDKESEHAMEIPVKMAMASLYRSKDL